MQIFFLVLTKIFLRELSTRMLNGITTLVRCTGLPRLPFYRLVRAIRIYSICSQNKEGILPVATLFIALYVPGRSRSDSNVAPKVTILSSDL